MGALSLGFMQPAHWPCLDPPSAVCPALRSRDECRRNPTTSSGNWSSRLGSQASVDGGSLSLSRPLGGTHRPTSSLMGQLSLKLMSASSTFTRQQLLGSPAADPGWVP